APGADPYLAYLASYTWGSNQIKASQGNLLTDVATFAIDPAAAATARKYAARYVHYLHGVNPLALVYLSSMGAFGAESSVTRFYHSWFARGGRRHVALRAAPRLPHRRAEPLVHLGRVLPLELRSTLMRLRAAVAAG